MKRIQAQRKFAQGVPLPPNNIGNSERRVEIPLNKEESKSVVHNNTPAKVFLDHVSFNQIHEHRVPIVLIERLKTNASNPFSLNQRNEESDESNEPVFNTINLARDTMRLRSHIRVRNNSGMDESCSSEQVTNSSTEDSNIQIEDSREQQIEKRNFQIQNTREHIIENGKELPSEQSGINKIRTPTLWKMAHNISINRSGRNFNSNMSDVSIDDDKPLAHYVAKRKRLSASKIKRLTMNDRKKNKSFRKSGNAMHHTINGALRRSGRRIVMDYIHKANVVSVNSVVRNGRRSLFRGSLINKNFGSEPASETNSEPVSNAEDNVDSASDTEDNDNSVIGTKSKDDALIRTIHDIENTVQSDEADMTADETMQESLSPKSEESNMDNDSTITSIQHDNETIQYLNAPSEQDNNVEVDVIGPESDLGSVCGVNSTQYLYRLNQENLVGQDSTINMPENDIIIIDDDSLDAVCCISNDTDDGHKRESDFSDVLSLSCSPIPQTLDSALKMQYVTPCLVEHYNSFTDVIEAPDDEINKRCKQCLPCKECEGIIKLKVVAHTVHHHGANENSTEDSNSSEYFFFNNKKPFSLKKPDKEMEYLWQDIFSFNLDILRESNSHFLNVTCSKNKKLGLKFKCKLLVKSSASLTVFETHDSKMIKEYLQKNFNLFNKQSEYEYLETIFLKLNDAQMMMIDNENIETSCNDNVNQESVSSNNVNKNDDEDVIRVGWFKITNSEKSPVEETITETVNNNFQINKLATFVAENNTSQNEQKREEVKENLKIQSMSDNAVDNASEESSDINAKIDHDSRDSSNTDTSDKDCVCLSSVESVKINENNIAQPILLDKSTDESFKIGDNNETIHRCAFQIQNISSSFTESSAVNETNIVQSIIPKNSIDFEMKQDSEGEYTVTSHFVNEIDLDEESIEGEPIDVDLIMEQDNEEIYNNCCRGFERCDIDESESCPIPSKESNTKCTTDTSKYPHQCYLMNVIQTEPLHQTVYTDSMELDSEIESPIHMSSNATDVTFEMEHNGEIDISVTRPENRTTINKNAYEAQEPEGNSETYMMDMSNLSTSTIEDILLNRATINIQKCEPSTSGFVNTSMTYESDVENDDLIMIEPPCTPEAADQTSQSDVSSTHNDPTSLDAPVFRPSAAEFSDPVAYFESIIPSASKFGICKVVPPPNFIPTHTVNDEMVFNATNQYIARLFRRWGPGSREMSSIKAYLASQSVVFKRAPLYEGMEVNLPKLYKLVQCHGGLKKVIERKRWSRVAEEMRFTKRPNPEKKLDQLYVKYLLPYDTLTREERLDLKSRIERVWSKKYRKMMVRAFDPLHRQNKLLGSCESSEDDDYDDDEYITCALAEVEECVVPGRRMNLSTFKKVASTALDTFFTTTSQPTPAQVEEEYWQLVQLRKDHLCVNSASIDTGTAGYGFTKNKSDSYVDHTWNLKTLATNKGNILRFLGPEMGVTVPTLHLGMVFSTSCWHRDPHGLPWMEFMHTGPPKIWYGIPENECQKFRNAVESLCPTSCQNKTIWLPSDIAMIPPKLLKEHNVTLSRVEQHPGEYIIVFPKAYSSSICTGYTVSESVYFASISWLKDGLHFFNEAKTSCEPTMISIESLLMAIATDSRTTINELQLALKPLKNIIEFEIKHRILLESVTGASVAAGTVKHLKHGTGAWNVREHDECEVCRKALYLSRVRGWSETETSLCLEHAICLIQKRKAKNLEVPRTLEVHYHFSEDEMNSIILVSGNRIYKSLSLSNRMQSPMEND